MDQSDEKGISVAPNDPGPWTPEDDRELERVTRKLVEGQAARFVEFGRPLDSEDFMVMKPRDLRAFHVAFLKTANQREHLIHSTLIRLMDKLLGTKKP